MQSSNDRDAIKEATIKKKRLKFDIIPIKTVLEVRKTAINDNNIKVQNEEKLGQDFVKENNGIVEITSPNKLNTMKLKQTKNKIESNYINRVDL